jgi:hypothetical protein
VIDVFVVAPHVARSHVLGREHDRFDLKQTLALRSEVGL